jgi:hypothetical protein
MASHFYAILFPTEQISNWSVWRTSSKQLVRFAYQWWSVSPTSYWSVWPTISKYLDKEIKNKEILKGAGHSFEKRTKTFFHGYHAPRIAKQTQRRTSRGYAQTESSLISNPGRTLLCPASHKTGNRNQRNKSKNDNPGSRKTHRGNIRRAVGDRRGSEIPRR